MKRIFGILMIGVFVFVTGFTLASVSGVGRTEAASLLEPRTVDGQVVLEDRSQPAQPFDLQAASPAIYSWTYGAYEFYPASSALTYASSGGGLYAVDVPLGGPSMRCALDLPTGALIYQINFYVIDNSDTDYMDLAIFRIQPSAGITQTKISGVTTSGLSSSPNVRTISITGNPIATIDRSTYAYFLRYGPVITGDKHILVGAQIQFSVPTTYLPLVAR